MWLDHHVRDRVLSRTYTGAPGHDKQPPIKPFGLLYIKETNECLIKIKKNEINY